MPDTTTTSSNEEDFGRHPCLDWIRSAYDEELMEGIDVGDAFKRHDLVGKWYKWCDRKYPDASLQDWAGKVVEAGEHVDIRALIRGQPIAGYAILQFLEACYAVDKALCGTDAEAFAEVRLWHMPEEMSAYNYLLSGDMMQWWVKELAELKNEIESPSSNLISLSWKIMDLGRCLTRLEAVLESGSGIATNIWTTMGEDNGSAPPAGTFEAICDRVQGLKDSLGILRKALERRKQRDATSDVPPTTSSHGYVESTGIRRRIPRAASPISENDPEQVRTDTDTTDNHTATTERATRAPDARPPTWINMWQKATSMFRLAMGLINTTATRYKANVLLEFFFDKETAILVSICFTVVSASLMVTSVTLATSQPPTSCERSSDANFLGNLSQSILSYLSIYLIITSTIHNKSIGTRYQFWFWVCLIGSFLSSILGLSLYCAAPPAAIVLLWAPSFIQGVIPVLLVVQSRVPQPRDGDDVESHRE